MNTAKKVESFHPDGNPSDWVPLARAAGLTGLSESAWRKRAESLAAKGQAQKAPPPGDSGGKPTWYFHQSCDARLTYLAGEREQVRKVQALSGAFPAAYVALAALRLRWLRKFEAGCRDSLRGVTVAEVAAFIVAEAKEAEGDGFKISYGSLRAWARRFREIDPTTRSPRGVDGLIDRYGVENETPRATRSPEAVRYFYALYHTEQRISVRGCHDATLREAKRKGWAWADSETATREWLKAHDDREWTLLCRHGKRAYQHRAMPFIEQDYEKLRPGEMYVCDHHQCKYFVLHRGKPIRPWLTAVMDARTRVVVGWDLVPAPHSDAIMNALRRAVIDWGISETVKIDNGRDYTAKVLTGETKRERRELRARLKREHGDKWRIALREARRVSTKDQAWVGILPELGCQVKYAIPYAPWTKLIERWFRTFTDQHARTRPTFCDTHPDRKPEGLKEILAHPASLPTIEEEAQAVKEYIDLYHWQAHRGHGMNGRSPLAVWQSMPNVCGHADADALNLMMTIRGKFKVGANGVSVRIGSTTVGYGQYSGALRAHFGREVLVAVDPQAIDSAVILTLERKVICRVPWNVKHSPAGDATAQDMREAQAEVNRVRKDARKASAQSPQRILRAAEMMNHQRRNAAEAIRATGTDGKPAPHPEQNFKAVPTGIEAPSTPLEPAELVSPGDWTQDGEGDDFTSLTNAFLKRTEKPTPSPRAREALDVLAILAEPIERPKPTTRALTLEDLL